MIQRIQTIYLFLATGVGMTAWFIPFGVSMDAMGRNLSCRIADGFFLSLALILTVLIGMIALFLFKRRKVQFRVALLGILTSGGISALEYLFVEGRRREAGILPAHYTPGVGFPLVMVLLFILAARAIRKDEHLIKSLDRLR